MREENGEVFEEVVDRKFFVKVRCKNVCIYIKKKKMKEDEYKWELEIEEIVLRSFVFWRGLKNFLRFKMRVKEKNRIGWIFCKGSWYIIEIDNREKGE